jgi:hypothetical protein
VLLTACGAEEPPAAERPTAHDSGARTAGDPEPQQQPEQEPVACADLLEQGWEAPPTDPSIMFDPETGHAEVAFTEPGDTIVVDVADADCVRLPDVGPLLARTVGNHEEARAEECQALVDDLLAGREPSRGGVTADPEAMRAYVLAECPESFAAELSGDLG